MKTLAELSDADLAEYTRALGGLVGPLVPADGLFALAIISTSDGRTNYVSSGDRRDMPAALRALADHLEQDFRERN